MHSWVISESSEPTTALDTRWVSTNVNWMKQITPNPSCHWGGAQYHEVGWWGAQVRLLLTSLSPGLCTLHGGLCCWFTAHKEVEIPSKSYVIRSIFFSLSCDFPWISSFYHYEIEEESNMNLLESLPWDSFFSHLYVKNNKSLVWRPKSPFPGPVNPVIFLGLILPLIKDVS